MLNRRKEGENHQRHRQNTFRWNIWKNSASFTFHSGCDCCRCWHKWRKNKKILLLKALSVSLGRQQEILKFKSHANISRVTNGRMLFNASPGRWHPFAESELFVIFDKESNVFEVLVFPHSCLERKIIRWRILCSCALLLGKHSPFLMGCETFENSVTFYKRYISLRKQASFHLKSRDSGIMTQPYEEPDWWTSPR